MEGKYWAEMFNEVLMEACISMSHELQTPGCFIVVEEEMLMHKFYEVTYGQGLNQKKWRANTRRRCSSDRALLLLSVHIMSLLYVLNRSEV
ncbi:hypothetical protein MKX03_016893 [Papaver bracteatum]|nr:hypothetical protein MKX03_016893 [Papaver bracteatum]